MRRHTSNLVVFLLFFIFSITASKVLAQERRDDLIVKRDSTRIPCRIQIVSESLVEYKKATDPEGPVFHISKSDIARIVYGNGETEFISKDTKRPVTESNDLILYPSKPWLIPGFVDRLHEWDDQELRDGLSFYQRKATARKTTAIAAATIGTLCSVMGIVFLVEGNRYDPASGYYYSGNKREIGQMLLVGGLGAGVPVTIVNSALASKYRKRAKKVDSEMMRRNLSLNSLKLLPSIDPLRGTFALSFTLKF